MVLNPITDLRENSQGYYFKKPRAFCSKTPRPLEESFKSINTALRFRFEAKDNILIMSTSKSSISRNSSSAILTSLTKSNDI